MRTAVVGLAGMGAGHVRAVQNSDQQELVAVCDVAQEPLAKVADATGAKPFTSTNELYASGLVDAVVIATPPFLHLEQVREALQAGLHVYCEKPMVLHASQADEIAALAAASGKAVQIGFQHRFQHSFSTARRMIADGAIGQVYRANLTSTNWFRPNAYFAARPWRGRWENAGGGVLMNQAIHHVDAYLWMVGMPKRVSAKAWRARHDVAVEDDVLVMLEFADGGRGVIVASTIDPVGTDRLEMHGELGSLLAQGQTLRHVKLPEAAQHINDTCPDAFPGIRPDSVDVAAEGRPTTFNEFVAACHADFVDSAAAGRAPLNNPVEAGRAIEFACAVYLSALRREPVDLPLDRDVYLEAFAGLCDGRLALPTRPGVDG